MEDWKDGRVEVCSSLRLCLYSSLRLCAFALNLIFSTSLRLCVKIPRLFILLQ